MSFNPIRRSRIKPKAKRHKENAPWRTPRVRLNGQEMKELRGQVFDRAGMQCENTIDGTRCKERIFWGTFHMHHLIHRSRGGSDVISNVLAVCWQCHASHHDGIRTIVPHLGE